MFINITKSPVIIFASPRTGSTALGYHLSSQTNLRFFCEPSNDESSLKEFVEYNRTENNYILKLIGSSIVQYPDNIQKKILSNDVFKIKITRRNFIKQIASHYIAMSRNRWHYINWDFEEDDDTYEKFKTTDIIIDNASINFSIASILYEKKIINKIATDVELYYEEFIKFNSAEFNSVTEKTPRPKNYDDLLEIISNNYEQKLYHNIQI